MGNYIDYFQRNPLDEHGISRTVGLPPFFLPPMDGINRQHMGDVLLLYTHYHHGLKVPILNGHPGGRKMREFLQSFCAAPRLWQCAMLTVGRKRLSFRSLIATSEHLQ